MKNEHDSEAAEEAAFLEAFSPEPPIRPAFEAALYIRSARLLRRRIWLRRGALSSLLLIAYAAGALTFFSLREEAPASGPRLAAESPQTPRDPLPLSPSAPASQIASGEAVAIRLARLAPADQAELLRNQGDYYLLKAGDPRRAAHCYRRLLALTPEESGYRVLKNDTWLLATLKRALQPKARIKL